MTGWTSPEPRLDGRTLLIAGGAGGVGEGLVTAALLAGARVIVPSRSADRLDALRDGVPPEQRDRLVTFVAEIGSEAGAEQLSAWFAEAGEMLDGVVASLGGWWQGLPLVAVPPDLWHRLLADLLHAHYHLARATIPLLLARRSASYLFVNGFASETPVPGAGPVAIAAAAQLMLARTLMAEHADGPLRINSMILGPIVTRHRRGRIDPSWLSATDVGTAAAWLASDAAAGRRGEVLRLPDRGSLLAVYGAPA